MLPLIPASILHIYFQQSDCTGVSFIVACLDSALHQLSLHCLHFAGNVLTPQPQGQALALIVSFVLNSACFGSTTPFADAWASLPGSVRLILMQQEACVCLQLEMYEKVMNLNATGTLLAIKHAARCVYVLPPLTRPGRRRHPFSIHLLPVHCGTCFKPRCLQSHERQ